MKSKPAHPDTCYTALIGGSFDPIHNGHLYLARCLNLFSNIESVVFLPVGKHNFKKSSIILPFEKRLALIKSVLEPGIEVWLDDAQSSGYTADLIRNLRIKHPDRHFAFVIGSDNLPTLHQWHDFEWLKTQLSFIIIPRVGYGLEALDQLDLDYTIQDIIAPDISSSQIRKLISQKKSIKSLVPSQIESLVQELYETQE